MSSILLLGLVDTDAWDEGQPSRNLLLVLHIVLCKEMDEGELLLLDPLPEEPPAGYCVAQYTNRVTQHDLQQSTSLSINKTEHVGSPHNFHNQRAANHYDISQSLQVWATTALEHIQGARVTFERQEECITIKFKAEGTVEQAHTPLHGESSTHGLITRCWLVDKTRNLYVFAQCTNDSHVPSCIHFVAPENTQ